MELSMSEILKMKEPGELFSGDKDTLKKEYRDLVKKYHPDLHGNSDEATEVMRKINELHGLAEKMISKGDWKTPGLVKVVDKDGKTHTIRYRIERDFELGKIYISDTVIVYLYNEEHRDFLKNAEINMKSFSYADDKMEKDLSRFLPKIVDMFETDKGQYGVVISKTKDVLPLRELLKYHNNYIPDRHVAWVMSGLYHLACYIQYSGLSHNAVTLDNIFISPQHHGVCLLGGWGYAVQLGKKMLGVPEGIFDIMPPMVKKSKLGNIGTDLESIRLVGRQLLGDRNGTRIATSGLPKPLIDWLRGVSSDSAFNEYKNWSKVLTDSYGARKFVEMPVDIEEFYTKVKGV